MRPLSLRLSLCQSLVRVDRVSGKAPSFPKGLTLQCSARQVLSNVYTRGWPSTTRSFSVVSVQHPPPQGVSHPSRMYLSEEVDNESAAALAPIARSISPRVPWDVDNEEVPQPMSRFGTERTKLGQAVAVIMDGLPQRPRYFLDNGTLLGLWRGNALIDHDDDFDFGVLVDSAEFCAQWMEDLEGELTKQLKLIPGEPYQCRIVDTYAQKIEVYEASFGSFKLDGERYLGARYHHVSVDLQIHVLESDKEEVRIQHSDFGNRGPVAQAAYLPFKKLEYAGTNWPIPAQPKALLNYLYGYVGLNAVLDPIAMLYRKEFEQKRLRVYTDMCADLFHSGHVNYLKQCKQITSDIHLVVGIHSDATIQSYKRASICTMQERIAVVEACKYVDEVIASAPLRVTQEYMEQHNIDLVVHGDQMPDAERLAMYNVPIEAGMYTEVFRTNGISTTTLIDRVASRLAVSYEKHAIPSERDPAKGLWAQMRCGLGF